MGSINQKIDSDLYSEYIEGPITPCKCYFKDLHHILISEPLEYLIAYKITHHSIKMMPFWMELCLNLIIITVIILSLGFILFFIGKPRKLFHRDVTVYLYCPLHLQEYTVLLEINLMGKSLRWGFYRLNDIVESLELNWEEQPMPIIMTTFNNLKGKYRLFKWNCIYFSESIMNEIKMHPELIRFENLNKSRTQIEIFEGSTVRLLDPK